jgi:hypothetical protein
MPLTFPGILRINELIPFLNPSTNPIHILL